MQKPQQTASTVKRYAALLDDMGVLASPVDAAALSDSPIAFATCDSREVVPGTLFVCKGAAFKRDYLMSAIEAGAVCYVSETDYEAPIPCLLVTDIRKAMGAIADFAWGHPSGKIDVCAFTGTKGKTTSVYYLKGIFDAQARAAGTHTAAMFSSIEMDDGIERGEAKLTTPEPFDLERHLANAVAAGAEHVAMEASSQALKYGRTFGVEFAVGAFTNIGEDHISPIEHPTFEDYFASKLLLFKQCETAVVNLDMDRADKVYASARERCPRVITYSLEHEAADVFGSHLRHTEGGITFTVRTPRFEREVLLPTPVRFNVSNALGAIACAEGLGIDEECIVHGFEGVMVPGRMNLYPTPSGRIMGVVDFAHNGMSLETLLRDLRENYPDRELCVVFGATGGKGMDRRETMGVAAGKFADRIVITEDDPGPEDPADICATIAHFIEEQGNHAWQIEVDREAAIRKAVFETERPAVVIVTGKGHETRMMRRGGAEPCRADGVILREALDEFDAMQGENEGA